MRKSLFIFSLICGSVSFTQQTEHYTQFEYNQFAFNPAVAGTKSCIDIRTGYRFQWVGIDGAPETGFINAHAPLRFGKKSRSSFGPKSGIGGMIKRDVFGPLSFLQVEADYALHVPISRTWTISVGVGFGLKQTSFDVSSLTTELADPLVPASGQSFLVFPDGKLGFWAKDKRNYVGLSIHNLFGNKINAFGENTKLQRHIYLTAGRSFSLEGKWSLIPSFFMLWTAKTPTDFHLSLLADLDNKFSFGLGMRRTDAITAQVRVKLFNFISIGYSFDFIISQLGKSNNQNFFQTHEITSGFNGCSSYGSSSTTNCPAFE